MASKRRVLAVTAALALLAGVVSLCVGAVTVPPGELLAALAGRGEGTGAAIVLYVRLPRTAGCLAAGACLAVAGAVIQTVLANPLASPSVIGVNAGAGAAVALCCALAPMAVGLTPIAAFGGAFGSAMLVLAVSQRAGASRMTLILTGVALSSIFSAAVDLVVTLVPDALNGYSDFRVGGLGSVTMARVAPAAAVGAVCLAGLLLLTNELDVLALGTETARSLGLQVGRMRVIVLALAAGLAGAAVSVAAVITAFVQTDQGIVVQCALFGIDDETRFLVGQLFGLFAPEVTNQFLSDCDSLNIPAFFFFGLAGYGTHWRLVSVDHNKDRGFGFRHLGISHIGNSQKEYQR